MKKDEICTRIRLRQNSSGVLLSTIVCAGMLALAGCTGLTSAKNKPNPAPSPSISVEPSAIFFGSIELGTTKTQTLSIANLGTDNLVISQAIVAGDGFSVGSLKTPLTLGPGQSSSFAASFTPERATTAAGSISLLSNASGSPTQVPISGIGRAATSQLSVSTTSLNFGDVTVATSSNPAAVTLTNTGNSSVTVSQINVTGDRFQASGLSFPLNLAIGQSASFSALFVPTMVGSVVGSLAVISSATNSPAAILLSGTGVQSQISVVPGSVGFGDVPLGSTNSQTLTLSNPGSANLSVTQLTLNGAGFTLGAIALPFEVAPGQSTQLMVSFAPTASGTASGSLSLINNAPSSPVTIALSGVGIAPVLQLSANPTAINFGDIVLGGSGTQSVTLTNTGNSNVSVSRITVTGNAFSVNGLALPVTLSAGQTASFSVVFAPIAAGGQAGSVTILSTASNSPHTITSSGSGVQPVSHYVTLSWTPSTSTVAGYYIYRGAAIGGPYDKLNAIPVDAPAYSDTTVEAGATYFYVVTAVDGAAIESEHSNEVSAFIPTP